jgi:mannose-6-phosphate isomerase-like protein (cupin superfamily)
MDNDMVCYITAGEFKIEKGEMAFNVQEGDVYTCGKGKPDKATNTGSVVEVHRIVILIPA